MRSPRLARVTVAIWTRLLAGLSLRTVAVVVAALLTAGLVAAPTAPAQAAAATPAAGAASAARAATTALTSTTALTRSTARTATTATTANPVVATFGFPSYSPAEMSAVMDNWWPESLGFPDNSPLAQLLSGTWTRWNAQSPPSDWLPAQPANLYNASFSVTSDGATGSILTITAPLPSAITVTSGSDPGWDPIPAGIMAQIAGAAAAAGALAVCGAFLFGLPTNDSGWAPEFGATRPWTKGVCGAAVTLAWATAATDVGSYLTKGTAPTTGTPWHALIGAGFGGAAAGYGFPYVGSLTKALQYAWIGLYVLLGSKVSRSNRYLLEYLIPYMTSGQWNGLYDAVDTLGRGALQQLSNPLTIASQLGVWTPVASGYVGNVPTGTAVTVGSGDCMDAYGTTQTEPALPPAVPGQPVAINACNGNPSQVFTFWPNGQIESWGMCMDDNGDTSSSDRPVVNLQVCDGGYTQLWYENGAGAIVNAETGNCLDDPGTNTTPGTQLRLYPCNGSSAQVWAPPGGTDAVTGFDRILSVLNTQGSQLCMMPQTSLANPVGSNIITESATGNVCFSNATGRKWAVGSNDTLMANGTNALCMDSNGPATTGPGGEAAYFVQLQYCDGSQSQVWHVISTYLGPTLQNAANGLCVNTPSGQLGLVVSMVVASCASPPYGGELWTLPGFSAPHGLLAGGPCDIYSYYGTPCAAAYSMTRALYAGYAGPLYQVTRASDGQAADIGLLAAGGYVKATEQDSFCFNTACTVTKIYDQSPEGNNLTIGGPGGPGCSSAPGYNCSGEADHGADAGLAPVTIDTGTGSGIEAYGLDITGGVGYANDSTHGVAVGSQPEGTYMVASGTHVNGQCCMDFGNAETNRYDNGNGHMDAVRIGTGAGIPGTCWFTPCNGSGPWVGVDMENGTFLGANGSYLGNAPVSANFVTAMAKNDGSSTYAIKTGDAHSGGLTTQWAGALPNIGGYMPMQKEGGIVLGTGGDNSNAGVGTWFEGVMTAGYPSDAADNAVQASIVAAGYAGNSAGSSASSPSGNSAAGTAGQAVLHDGYTSVYTVNIKDHHLQETYLAAAGGPWATQDLSATVGTPAVKAGTQPVAVYHDGYTSVYTVDASSGHLDETFLAAICSPNCAPGQGWAWQDLSAHVGTPPTAVTPGAVYHSGYTSVYTVDASSGHLDETFLDAICSPNCAPGQGWAWQDLSAHPGTPPVRRGTSPVAVLHDGYTSVYTVDASSGHLDETFLAAICAPNCAPGEGWAWQDLSKTVGTPRVAIGSSPVALFHDGYNSVYTIDAGATGNPGHLDETYLAAICAPNCAPGQGWAWQDLSAHPGTPLVQGGRTPIALLHLDQSGGLHWVSVWTIAYPSGDLDETYLPGICAPNCSPGQGWAWQDLSANYHVPPAT
ncbi:MAG: xlnA 3 [Actinomycetia bacterium]|nr:xlnA 3 [Actinomycetes bacterium]